MPIDKSVLERVERHCVAERVAWAVGVASRAQWSALYGGLLHRLETPGHYATIEDLRRAEEALVGFVRTQATHANYALDQLSGDTDGFWGRMAARACIERNKARDQLASARSALLRIRNGGIHADSMQRIAEDALRG